MTILVGMLVTALAAPLVAGRDTPAAAAPALRIAVVGDYGHDNTAAASVAALVASWTPTMVVTTGDNYYLAGAEPGTDRFDRTVGRHYCAFLRGAAPGPHCPSGGTSPTNRFFPTLGNHDYSNAGLANYLAYFDLAGEAAQGRTPSGSERYYDMRNGPVHFFMLDSEGALGSAVDLAAQRAWVQQALAASDAPWKIVVFHHPPYSSSSVHGSTPAMQWPFATWGADLVLNGHDHTYERVERDGISYVVDGLGGAPVYAFGAAVAGSAARYNGGFGALRVTVDDTTLTTEFVDVAGTVIDRTTRTRRVGPVVEPLGSPSQLTLTTPRRILDTRAGTGAPPGRVPPGGSIDLTVTGRNGVPAGATAFALNVTLVDATDPGFVQALPTSRAAVGDSSTINIDAPGATTANLAIVPVGRDGRVTLYSQGGGHLVADLLGWSVESGPVAAGRFVAVTPARVLDTRVAPDAPDAPAGAVPPGGSRTLALRGVAGIPTSGAGAVVLNLTATDADPGYLQVLPGIGTTGIGAWSNLNVGPAASPVANLVLAPLGPDGRITVQVEARAHVLVDVLGYITDQAAPSRGAGRFVPTRPTRLVDTRSDRPAGAGRLRPRDSLTFGVSVDRNEPARRSAAAVLVNVTATETTAAGYLQLIPAGEATFGSSSTVNANRDGQTVANASIVALSSGARSLSAYSDAGTHVLVDIGGYFTAE